MEESLPPPQDTQVHVLSATLSPALEVKWGYPVFTSIFFFFWCFKTQHRRGKVAGQGLIWVQAWGEVLREGWSQTGSTGLPSHPRGFGRRSTLVLLPALPLPGAFISTAEG